MGNSVTQLRQGCYEGDLDEVKLALALRADVDDTIILEEQL